MKKTNQKTKTSKNKKPSSSRSKQSSGLTDIRENVVGTFTEGFDRVGTEFTRAANSNSVRNAAWVIGGAAAGVALAYFLDPAAGSDRRSAVTGKLGGKINSLKQSATDMAGDRITGLRGSLREYLARGLSVVKTNFMDQKKEADFSEDHEDETDSQTKNLPASRKNSKNYSGYQDNTYSEQ